MEMMMRIDNGETYTCDCCERAKSGSDLQVTECGILVCEDCIEDYCYYVESGDEAYLYLK